MGCVTRDKNDPDRRIDGIGVVERDGTTTKYSLDDAIDKQNNEGVIFFVRRPNLRAVEIVVRKREDRLYLATLPERAGLKGQRKNNLSSMPECPAA